LGLRKILAKEEVESFLDFVFEFLTSSRSLLQFPELVLGEVLPCFLVFEETALLELFAGTARTGIVSPRLPDVQLFRKGPLASGGLVSLEPILELLPSDPVGAANSLRVPTLKQIKDRSHWVL
jgi:hypothetical protein